MSPEPYGLHKSDPLAVFHLPRKIKGYCRYHYKKSCRRYKIWWWTRGRWADMKRSRARHTSPAYSHGGFRDE